MESSNAPAPSGAGSRPAGQRPTDLKSATRDAAAQLRARLLQMILTNEESRHSAIADSLKSH